MVKGGHGVGPCGELREGEDGSTAGEAWGGAVVCALDPGTMTSSSKDGVVSYRIFFVLQAFSNNCLCRSTDFFRFSILEHGNQQNAEDRETMRRYSASVSWTRTDTINQVVNSPSLASHKEPLTHTNIFIL